MEWTKSAIKELDRYFDQIRPNLQSTGADPMEVMEDIRRHIDEELSALKLDIVTAEDIKRVVLKMGLPGWNLQPAPAKTSEFNSFFSRFIGMLPDWFIVLFGIILPAAAFCIEIVTHMCGRTFFDPIPTIGHCILAAFVPVSNLVLWLSVKNNRYSKLRLLGFANSVAIGISFFYTLLYLPLLPIAAIAVVYMGFGLLPMSPLLAFLSALILRKRLRRASQSSESGIFHGLGSGAALAIVLMLALEMPSAITRIGLEMSKSESPHTSLNGVKLLRAAGNQESMLRFCYQRQGNLTDIVSFIFNLHDSIIPNEARTIFYRVYGIPFNSLPAPNFSSGRMSDFDLWDFDAEQGGAAVSGVLKGLSISNSRIDASIDADAALAYTEWILEFQNRSELEREARAQIALPPDGVVSRLTLWINGEEREAAFAGRGKAREAYQNVVQQRKDPVLVTTSGRDRILVQCFPVPPLGGTMKVRIGISSPLILRDMQQGYYLFPHFLERNFKIPPDLTHSAWVEAKKPIRSDNKSFVSENPKKELYALRGELKDADMATGAGILRADRSSEIQKVWTPDPLTHGEQVIKQEIIDAGTDAPACAVIVIDGSKSLKDFSPSIIQAIRSIPEQVKPLLLFVTDEAPGEQNSSGIIDLAGSPNLDDLLNPSKFAGGQDNAPALLKALEEASRREKSVVLWVHGPQPIIIKSVEGLRQQWERRPNGPRLVEMPLVHGPNRILEQLDGVPYIVSAPRLSDAANDLKFLFSNYASAHNSLELKREKAKGGAFPSGTAKETSSHLARLWAHDEVMRLAGAKEKTAFDDAVLIAANYRIVTPVSGAVVLQNRQQYTAAGLVPVDPANVPTIPEPGAWLLLLVVASLLAWTVLRRKAHFQ
jgi:hypothetical protein